MKISETIINAKVYENAKEFLGIADVALPDLTAVTQTVEGVGIAGKYEASVPGYYDTMSMTINFRSMTDGAVSLAEPRSHQIEVRVAEQVQETTTREKAIRTVKHVFIAVPKKLGGGTVGPAAQNTVSGEYAVSYWAIYLDGTKTMEVDPLNNICVINGKDFLADVRAFLG